MDLNSKETAGPDIHFAIGSTCEHARLDYISEHVVCHIINGEMRVVESDLETIYRAGDSFLLRRNSLVKCEQRPTGSGVKFKVIFVVLRKDFLNHYAAQHGFLRSHHKAGLYPQVRLLKNTPSLLGLFSSFTPYMDADEYPSATIKDHKLTEMLICLQEQDGNVVESLFTIMETGKVDLAEFMERNFRFNVPMSKFAELSGRSLSTFQRDFLKYFGVPATTWLLKRRLEEAQYLLANDKKPSEVYLEVGFEDLSHFSRVFKKTYGYTPSRIKSDI